MTVQSKCWCSSSPQENWCGLWERGGHTENTSDFPPRLWIHTKRKLLSMAISRFYRYCLGVYDPVFWERRVSYYPGSLRTQIRVTWLTWISCITYSTLFQPYRKEVMFFDRYFPHWSILSLPKMRKALEIELHIRWQIQLDLTLGTVRASSWTCSICFSILFKGIMCANWHLLSKTRTKRKDKAFSPSSSKIPGTSKLSFSDNERRWENASMFVGCSNVFRIPFLE